MSSSFLRTMGKAIGLFTILATILWLVPSNPAQAGTISSITVTPSTTDTGATATYNIGFTPATAVSQGSLNVMFQGSWENKFDISLAAKGTGTTSTIGDIVFRDSFSGAVGFNLTNLQANTAATLVVDNIKNPSKAGQFKVLIWTMSGFSNADGDPSKGQYEKTFNIGSLSIQGTVTDPDGNAVRDAFVMVRTDDFSFNNGTPTGTDGNYAVGGLTSGKTYKIEVFPPMGGQGGSTGLVAPDAVSVTYSGTLITKNLQFVKAVKTITGTVKKSNGTAVANANVMAFRKNSPGNAMATTNSSGAYTLLVSGGDWDVMPNASGGGSPGQQTQVDWAYAQPPTPVQFSTNTTAETKTVDFTVVIASATISGSVVKPDGTALSGMGVGVGIFNKSGFGTGSPIDNNGGFSARVPAGTYELGIWSQDDTYAAPALGAITVKDNENKNLGVIKLLEKKDKITVTVKDKTSGTGLGNIEVNSFQMDGGTGFSHTKTGSDGNATLKVTPGKWGVMAMIGFGEKGGEGPKPQALGDKPTSSLQYVITGGPKFVKVSSGVTATISFEAVEANATLNGTVIDSSGSVLTSIFGYAGADVGGKDDLGLMHGGGIGGPVERGSFSFKVPSGSYNVNMMMPPGTGYTSGEPTAVTIAANETKNLTLSVYKNDAAISGTIKDEDGNAVKNIFLQTFVTNKKGAWQGGNINPSNGTYSISVASQAGPWTLGFWIDPNSGYFSQPSGDNSVNPKAGETVSKDLVIRKANATITGTVKDDKGNAVVGAFVQADNHPQNKGDRVAGLPFFEHGLTTDADGKYSIKIPADKYFVSAFLPPEDLKSKKLCPPLASEVQIGKNETKTADLSFRTADVEIKGTVKKDGTANEGALVTFYSDKGGYIETETGSDGSYTVNVTKNENWHAIAEKDESSSSKTTPDALVSTESVFDTGTSTSKTVDLELKANTTPLSTPITSSFDSDNSKQIKISDGDQSGASISIPADALDDDSQGGNVTLTAAATTELPHQATTKPVSTGIDIKAVDDQGQPLTSLNSSATITLPYKESDIKAMGLTEDDLAASYFDDTAGTWKTIDGAASIDKTNDTITFSTSHFTVFALTANPDTTAPSAPTDIKATAGDAKVTLSWTNPTNSDFDHINIYRSTTSGTLGSKIKSTSGKTITSHEDTGLTNGTTYYYTVKAVDTSSNESTNTAQVSAKPGSLPKTGVSSENNQTAPWYLLSLPAVLLVAFLARLNFRKAR
ncbi:carboxypeptidase regulatory-like domain-containing protein [Candidatus Berkelbacteria bacterium]|nr:carboxypeptidase regulatory-like domain-containing protein [Candidatus Berkelbacteria bacterium]MBI4029872.1 carboxypeptidase regulatory-like domain-containing protein [Candidatus Berkelbacteria bacterium]